VIPEPLKIELQKPEIASLSDADAAAILSAKTLTVRTPVDTSRVKQFAFTSGVWARIRLAMRNASATDEIYGLCVSVVDWIDDPSGKISTLDVDLPVVRANLAALVIAGLATQSQVDEIVAMADHVVSWSSYHNIGDIGIGLIRNARRELLQEQQRMIDNG
jgi:hypothetical protein